MRADKVKVGAVYRVSDDAPWEAIRGKVATVEHKKTFEGGKDVFFHIAVADVIKQPMRIDPGTNTWETEVQTYDVRARLLEEIV